MTPVFLTIDTEIAWRHYAAGLDIPSVLARSFDAAGVGIAFHLAILARHRLKACFFVDPMPALALGLAPFRRLVEMILGAGQEVQLHCHPNWAGARLEDRGASARFELIDYTLPEQRGLISQARDLLVAAGAPPPVAFRAGSYGANDETLAALADLGIVYDSSHNGADQPWPSNIGLAEDRIAPTAHCGIVEVPVTLIEEAPGQYRNVQICALSTGEMRATIEHAIAEDHAAMAIVGHSFELANRDGTRANAIHVGRFEALCATLDERREAAPTVHFSDHPVLDLGRNDRALGPSPVRRRWRQVEQLWSNFVSERAV